MLPGSSGGRLLNLYGQQEVTSGGEDCRLAVSVNSSIPRYAQVYRLTKPTWVMS